MRDCDVVGSPVKGDVERILVGQEEAARLLGVSSRTISNWRKNFGLPSLLIGGRRLFDMTELRKWPADFAARSQ